MSKSRGPQIAQRRREARWFAWELIRLSKEYRSEVDVLVSKWTQYKLDAPSAGALSRLKYRKLMAGQDALDAFVSLRAEVARLNVIRNHIGAAEHVSGILSGNTHSPSEPRYKERSQWWLDQRSRFSQLYGVGVRSRWGSPPIAKWGKQQDADLLPELGIFERRWGLRFPLPPEFEISEEMDWDVLAVPMAKAVRTVESNRETVTIQVWPAVTGRDLILEFMKLELDQADPQKPGTRRRHTVSAEPNIDCQEDGSLLIVIRLPCDPKSIRTHLAKYLPLARHRFRNLQNAVRVARFVIEGKSWQEIGDLVIAEHVGGHGIGVGSESAAAARRRAARRLYQTFQNQQQSLLNRISS